MVSVALPVVLFAGLTVVSQVVSPARGQSLLPDLPSITTRGPAQRRLGRDLPRPRGGSGVNQFHLIFSGTPPDLATVDPRGDGRPRRAAPPGRSGS